MTRLEEIITTARLLAGTLEDGQLAVLERLCAAVEQQLEEQLLPDMAADRYEQSFISAAAWMALAALSDGRQADGISGFTAGNLSVQRGNGSGHCLRLQAQLLMAPFVKDAGFCFLGVPG